MLLPERPVEKLFVLLRREGAAYERVVLGRVRVVVPDTELRRVVPLTELRRVVVAAEFLNVDDELLRDLKLEDEELRSEELLLERPFLTLLLRNEDEPCRPVRLAVE